jgi:hypothetical protein
MNNEFAFIGWNTDNTSDKIWGYSLRPTSQPDHNGPEIDWVDLTEEYGWNAVVFWAARGKAMQIKPAKTGFKLNTQTYLKCKKGYNKITQGKLIEIWPSFSSEFEAKLLFEVLTGNIK